MLPATRTPVLIIPGWGNSGPAHWQTLWQAEEPDWVRVMQRDWERPGPVAWLAAIDEVVSGLTAKPVLVGHSLGAIAIVRWNAIRKGKAAGAFLVDQDGLHQQTVSSLAPGQSVDLWFPFSFGTPANPTFPQGAAAS